MSTCTFSKWNTDHDLIIKIFLSSRKEFIYTLSTRGGYSADRAKYGPKINPPQKSLRPSNKTQKILGPKINPPKNPMPNFRALKISRKH